MPNVISCFLFFFGEMGGDGRGVVGVVPCLIHKVQARKLSRITCFMERKILLGGAARVHD